MNNDIKGKIYKIRGVQVMLDFELAEIYGYSTKDFNRQVRNNIRKFPVDFMFQLTRTEVDGLLRCKIFTSSWGGNRYLPYAFTEQGIYMLMTVLKGEEATRQSIAIIRLFKSMKDYIIEKHRYIGYDFSYIDSKFSSYDKRFEVIEDEVKVIMENFTDYSKYKEFVYLDGERIESDMAYQNIYRQAHKSIMVVDNYVDIKTLKLLKAASRDVDITIFTDLNKCRIEKEFLEDFLHDTGMKLTIKSNKGKHHDRYVVLDYDSNKERVFHCGSSSKDGGTKISAIAEFHDTFLFHDVFRELWED